MRGLWIGGQKKLPATGGVDKGFNSLTLIIPRFGRHRFLLSLCIFPQQPIFEQKSIYCVVGFFLISVLLCVHVTFWHCCYQSRGHTFINFFFLSAHIFSTGFSECTHSRVLRKGEGMVVPSLDMGGDEVSHLGQRLSLGISGDGRFCPQPHFSHHVPCRCVSITF